MPGASTIAIRNLLAFGRNEEDESLFDATYDKDFVLDSDDRLNYEWMKRIRCQKTNGSPPRCISIWEKGLAPQVLRSAAT